MRLIDGDAKNLNPETINGINLDTAIKVVENFLSLDECKSPLHAYLCAVRDFAEWYRDELKNAPTVDAVEVVRCKDCCYWNRKYTTVGECEKLADRDQEGGAQFDCDMDDTDFCSYGKRKENT